MKKHIHRISLGLLSLAVAFQAHASRFSEEESLHMAEAGKESIQTLSREHFEAHRRSGIGLMYGWKSSYSSVRIFKEGQIKWTNQDRFNYIKMKLKPQFKQSLRTESAVDSYVWSLVGDQDNRPFTGSVVLTSCIKWALRHVKKAYTEINQAARYEQLLAVVRNKGETGHTLLKELQKDGWEAVYWNPDMYAPNETRPDRLPFHTGSAANAINKKKYIPPVRNPSPNDIIEIDHLLVNYRPSPGSSTRKESAALQRLKRVPFWVGIANYGNHVFVGYHGRISESHSPFMPDNVKNLEESDFATWGLAWPSEKYLSGVIMVPPGSWE